MKRITDKQAKFLRSLLRKVDHEWVDVDLLSKKEAMRLISKLVDQRNAQAQAKPRQADLPLPPPPPIAPTDPLIPPELIEFKRWAREVYQRGEQTITQLCALQDERFGVLKLS